MEQDDNFKNLVGNFEEYFKTQKQIGKLYVIEKTSLASSLIMTNFILLSVFLMVFFFLNLAVVYLLSEYFGKIFYGFLIVSSFYFIIGIVLYIKRDSWLKTPFTDSLIKKMLRNE